MGRGQKSSPTSFSPVTSINVEISPKNFLALIFNPFVEIQILWSNPFKIGVMKTSLIEMLKLANFGHMTTCTI